MDKNLITWLFEPYRFIPTTEVVEDDGYTYHTNDQYLWKFDNNWGVSAVKGPYTMGGKDGLWEIAIIQFLDDDTFEIIADNPVINYGGFMGYCDKIDINSVCQRVSALPYTSYRPEDSWMQESERMYDKWKRDLGIGL